MRGFMLCVNDTFFGHHFPLIKKHQKMLSIKDRQKRAMSASPKESILLNGGYLKTTFVCKFCPSEPGLHTGLCFEEYHTKIAELTSMYTLVL